jgi:hypothetical protein
MTQEQKKLVTGIREALKAMTFDTYEVLDHVLPAHAVDWRRKFAGIERNLDALEADGKCKLVTKDTPFGKMRSCDKCGCVYTSFAKRKVCHNCGREIEATE